MTFAAPAAVLGDFAKTTAHEAEAEARALAQAQRELVRAPRGLPFPEPPIARALEQAEEHLARNPSEDPTLQKAAEWFLDNYYLVRRVARQVAQDLPRGFVRRLPLLASGPGQGVPRIEALARALVASGGIEINVAALQRFVQAYQEVSPLTIAELWALPTLLRVAVLHALLRFLAELKIPVGGKGARDRLPEVAPFPLGPGPGVERSIRALRLLAEIDWKVFFESTNRVEAVLRNEDPARVYARMDFATCDSYRKAVEELAWDTSANEEEVAQRAVALAREHFPDERLGHVGYWLVDGGRSALEARLGYRARGLERVRRAVRRWPTASWLTSVALFTAAPLALVERYVAGAGARPLTVALALLLSLVPASVVAITFLQCVLARLLPPRALPQLDFGKGLPEGLKTLVVIPTLLGYAQDVEEMLRTIELHYLANPDPRLQFALLTDYVDSQTPPEGAALLESAAQGIAALNQRHPPGPFHLLHREPRWNESEGRFMGWERKRGKLEELNRLLRGDQGTSYARRVGEPAGLEDIRFVITLDSDTRLPMGAANRLAGLLAHPLNRAVFEPRTGRVVSGYTIVQPRIETTPASSCRTRFARIFAGEVGFDIYTHATSDLYQDLFGAGIYVGKGIYDVDAFARSLEGRVPENAIASHDLFEGVHGRTALASDIVLFEEYPSHYATYARRLHRWVRGDWQLLPWLLAAVPSARGKPLANPLSPIDRWKIVDNLRRSLAGPLLFLLLVSGWTWLPGSPLLWTLGALAVLLAPLLPFARGRRSLERGALAVAFLAHGSALVVDAVVRVLVRTAITRKHLLQWTSAADAARGLAGRSPRALLWRELVMSPVLAAAIALLVARVRPQALWVAAPLLALWLLAPELARVVSQPPGSREAPLDAGERRKLRLLARRTWLFFETFVGPNDQWLPVDNHQEEPHAQTAHRTSPTNIGMMLLSTLSAWDLGYLGPGEFSLRVRSSLDTLQRLAHYQGHLLNWYETRNLQPLLPRYVSTVDSGNLAGCLLALAQGCKQMACAPVLRAEAWIGLDDTLGLLEEALGPKAAAQAGPVRTVIARMRLALQEGRDRPGEAWASLRTLSHETCAELDRELFALVEAGEYRHEPALLHALHAASERLRHQLHQKRQEIDALLPWLALGGEPAAVALELPSGLRLDEVPAASGKLSAALQQWEAGLRDHGTLTPALEASARRLELAFRGAGHTARTLHDELLQIAARAAEEVRGMDFRLLYDRGRKLFHIGFNVTLDQLDPHHYDLLASEARLASYLAIVKRDAPEAHWSALGRPMTQVAGAPALLSWGGTMFEYLMPSLLMRSHPGTLIAQTCALAVEAQIAHGEASRAPWGISESAYARVDAHHTYQYRSFGVPGLGFKRGLEDDRVVAPYASMMALSLRPRAVMDNLARLERMGALGTYGLFEAVDLHPDRAPDGRSFEVVRSYMAHHQGMLLVALDNFIHRQVMVERFHADPSIETGELLLDERAPATAPAEWPISESVEEPERVEPVVLSSVPSPWMPEAQGRPQAFVLTNGRLSSVLTGSGGGGLRWRGLALTAYQPDPTREREGMRIYLRDEESLRVWPATAETGRTTFAVHAAEFHRREEGISVHVELTVAPDDDVEVRQITLHNESDRPRRLSVTSTGEPVLLAAEQAAAHPAFSRLFVVGEQVADLDALLFARRPRSAKEEHAVLVHRLVRDESGVTFAGFETDRGAFFGRCGSEQAPLALGRPGPLHGRTGAVLDPVLALMAGVELEPNGTATLAFVTAVGRSRSVALELARRCGSMHAVRWAFRDAEQEGRRRLQRTRLDPLLLPAVQRLYSALLFADPSLRAPPDVIAAGRPQKRRLWGRGISGDHPILLVRVAHAQAPLVRETLAAQRYLRACGVRLDLVLVDEEATGYASEASGTLRSELSQNQAEEWLNRPGGIFLIPADQLSGEERRHLEACARVVLDTRDGSLWARLARPAAVPPALPRFVPTSNDETTPRVPPRPDLRFDNGTGGFTVDGREYAISVRPGQPTPAPWCNVLANPEFGCLTSESSLGASWSQNSGENRLTPWRNDPVFDTPSEVLYLRDEETAAVWTTTPLPAGGHGEALVRHGAGYTTYARECHGLEQLLTVFVPAEGQLKIVRLRLKNTLPRRRRLTATFYAEWVLGTRREEQRAYVVSEFDRDNACLLASCSWNAEFGDRVAFLASELKIHGFTADRTEFLGRGGDYGQPEALLRWGLAGRLDAGVDPCGVLQVHLELEPGEELETHFLLGQAASRAEALQTVARYRAPAAIDVAWRSLQAFWDGLLGSVRVETPEPAMDLMLNRWLLHQTVSARIFGRTGLYQSSGAFGYRDQLQDVLALLHAAPERTRAHILESAAHQFEEGDVLHWWHPPSGRGVRTRCSDDLVWLPWVTAEYVLATGDVAILAVPVPFLTGEPLRRDEDDRYAQFEVSAGSAPLLEHCRRALERAATHGKHGLPLMGEGDWNDGMNRVGSEGRGESVWLGWFLSAAMNRFAALCAPAEARAWRDRAAALGAKVEACAWDGAWYVRAFHDDGSLVGSAKERECRIDSIAQSWAVLSGAADPQRARLALRSAGEWLVREEDRLVLLLTPPFDSTPHNPGYIRAYPPGVRENGGQYTHAATWLGFAHAALGDGEGAERIFRLLNPALRTSTAAEAKRYRTEPYVLAGDICGAPPWVGRGGWTWYTGAAGWAFRLGVEAILGLRKEAGALCIDPCIPPSWKGFEAWVRAGDGELHVVVENPGGVSRGVASVTLDGTPLQANRVPFAPGKHEVRVRLTA